MDSPALIESPVTFRRRVAAIVYDSIALLAVFFFATLAVVIYTGGQSIEAGNPYYSLYLLLWGFFYFAICWTRGGQTLGMRAWKIKLIDSGGERAVSSRAAGLRYVVALLGWALLGLGFLSALLRADRQTWHDRASHTMLIRSA